MLVKTPDNAAIVQLVNEPRQQKTMFRHGHLCSATATCARHAI
jgi:hypothetical protein